MERKRISVIVALAVVSTVSPLVYQYIIEPRMDAANVAIEIMDFEYNADESSDDMTGFTCYIKLTNPEENDVILSPLKLDVYYHIGSRFRLIGEFTTNRDYTIPANKFVGSDTTGRLEDHGNSGYNKDKEIKGIIYFYKMSGFYEGANEALLNLINTGSTTLKFKGTSQFGPISIPYESGEIDLKKTIWDPEIIIHDVFLYRDPSPDKDKFVLHTKMRNPSGLPLTLEVFNLNLYNKTDTDEDPVGPEDIVGWAINSRDVLSDCHDPDKSDNILSLEYLDEDKDGKGSVVYEFGTNKYEWKDVFFGFDFTNNSKTEADPDYYENIQWFVSALMGQPKISGITLKGKAAITLGDRELRGVSKGFNITTDEEDDDQYLTLSKFGKTYLTFYQKYIPKYSNLDRSFTGRDPITMFGNFSIEPLQVHKIVIDTDALNPTMTLGIFANMSTTNPYRFRYDVSDFNATYKHSASGANIAWSESLTNTNITAAEREWNATAGEYTKKIIPSVRAFALNLTTTYNTFEENGPNAGIFKIMQDLGGDEAVRLLNLTNPFYIDDSLREHDHNPMQTISYLVSQGVNPLTLLNEISLLAQVKNYQPLRGQHFGNDYRSMSEILLQADPNSVMPYLDDPRVVGDDSNFVWSSTYLLNSLDPGETLNSWNDYYDGGGGDFQPALHLNNQYEWVQFGYDDTGDGYFPEDEDLGSAYDNIRQTMYVASPGRVGSFDTTPFDDLVWRTYEAGTNPEIGISYDYFGYGDKGYFAAMGLNQGRRGMFSQNFTLDPDLFIRGAEDIEKVTLSISYQYCDPDYNAEPAYLMFSWHDGSVSNPYRYLTYGTVNAYDNRQGYTLPNPNDGGWAHDSLDLTQEFKNRLEPYYNVSSPDYLNSDLLKGEVSFAAWGGVPADTLRIHFDDIVLNIQYLDYNKSDTQGALTLNHLFEYLEEVDPINGNMFQIFNELSESAMLDNIDFWQFLADDGGPPRTGSGGMDFFKFAQFANVSLSKLTDLLFIKENYQELGIGEPANFLEMLTKNKYRPYDDHIDDRDDIVGTKYGPRILDDEYWAIEDPLNASRVIVDTLLKNIFVDENGAVSRTDFSGEELWYMLENLGVTMPWIVMYLLTHGWTKSDIFDMLEALGFAHETKYGFNDDRDWGQLMAVVDVVARVAGGIITLEFEDLTMYFDMDPVLSDGSQEFFSALCAAGTGYQQRPLVDNSGTFTNAEPYTTTGCDTWIFGIEICAELTVTPDRFGLQIYMNPTPSRYIPGTTDTSILESDAYLMTGEGGEYGFNDAGTQMLASSMRTNYKFAGETFITMGGDPVSLFQFLEDYFFGTYWDGSSLPAVDYTSFAVLNFFDCSGVDFIDIITGYNNITKTHDPNKNGLADDWIAPKGLWSDYNNAWNNPGAYQGWGDNFRDNRIFYWPGYNNEARTGQQNGKIIWTDCPDFASDWSSGGRSHSDGDIDIGTWPTTADRINESAPAIVDLLDMMAWISKTSGYPEPNTLFKWFLSELPPAFYDVVDPIGGGSGDGILNPSYYNDGLSNQKTWRMLQQASLNATGFFDWLENEKGINSFKLLLMLNESEGIITPTDLLFFATNPNMIRFFDGALSVYYHDALDSQNTDAANDVLWSFFSSSSFDEEGFFDLLNSTGFNIFDLFVDLWVDPASWFDKLNSGVPPYDLEPMTVLMYMIKYNPGSEYLTLTKGTSTEIDIQATLKVTYTVGSDVIELHARNINLAQMELTEEYHFDEFVDTSKLTGSNFQII